jgi:hypothetical protein
MVGVFKFDFAMGFLEFTIPPAPPPPTPFVNKFATID